MEIGFIMDNVLTQVTEKAKELALAENQCERGYAHLGYMLFEVSEMQYWRVNFDSFGDYLKSVSMDSKKTPGQLKQYVLTVCDLIDTFSCDQLEAMGISKAIKLRQAKDYALVLPKEIVDCALDPKSTVKDLKKTISVALKMPEEDGDWMDLECEFMVSPEQRILLTDAITAAMRTEPLTKSTVSRSAQMLDVMTKFAQEYLGAHCGDGV